MAWYRHWSVYTTVLGLLLGIGFVVPALWPLGLIGVAGVIYYFVYHRPTLLQAWWIYMVKASLVSVWIWAVYPIDWLGFSLGWVELPIIGFYWLTTSASLAVGGMVLAWVVRWLRVRYSATLVLLTMPLLWLMSELVQSFAFSVFLFGPGGTIGTTYSMGYIGYLLTEHALLIEVSRIAGVYGLTVLFVAIAVLLLHYYLSGAYKTVLVAGAVILLSTGLQLTDTVTGDSSYTVVTIDTFTPPESDERAAIMQAAINDALVAVRDTNPDYVILPEDSRYINQSLDINALRAVLSFWQGDSQAVLIDSGRTELGDDVVLQSVIYDGATKEVFQSQKSYLVPQGEFLPYFYSFLFTIIGQAESSRILQDRLAYRVGPNISQAHFSQRIPGILFCFEVVDARGVQRLMRNRDTTVPFVAHIISHAWIHPSVIFRHQLDSMLRVQAIWNQTYIVSAGNHIPGYTVSPTGAITYGETIAEGEYFEAKVTQIPRR